MIRRNTSILVSAVLSAVVVAASTFAAVEAVEQAQSSAASQPAGNSVQAPLSPAEETFLLGNVVFALLHEFGHAVISDFEVPLLGLEENSADTIAAVSLMLLDRDSPDGRFSTALGVAALVQAYVWETGIEREHGEVLLWAQHGLSAQRFARLVCLLYGNDPARFDWVAEAAQMNEIRADGCAHEWWVAEHAVLWLLETYGIPQGERASRPGAEIEVRYA